MEALLKSFINCKGEAVKQYRNYHSSLLNIVADCLWPLLMFLVTYYTYESFDLKFESIKFLSEGENLFIFILTGALISNQYWSIVQSAFYNNKERQNGTLEIVFLSPVNRMAMLYGRALGALRESFILNVLFVMGLLYVNIKQSVLELVLLFVALILIFLSSVIWGGFVNALFMITRDSNIFFTILDEPMNFFSGTKFPIDNLNTFFKVVSFIFPSTYCLFCVRSLLIERRFNIISIFFLAVSNVVLFFLTKLIMTYAEKKNMETGNIQLY